MKRIIVYGLIALMSIGCVSGCGKKGDSSTASQSEEAQINDSDSNEDKSKDKEADSADKDKSIEDNSTEEKQLSRDELETIYWDFIKGNSNMYFAAEQSDCLTVDTEYSYDAMCESIIDYIGEELYEEARLSDAQIAFIDCGDDGVIELALRQDYEMDWDRATYIGVFKYINNRIECIYLNYGYYRTHLVINEYGYISYGGSDGANSYSDEYSFINADGDEQFLYHMSVLSDLNEAVISSYHIPQDSLPEDYLDDLYSDSDNCITSYGYTFTKYKYDDYYKNDEYDDSDYLRSFFYSFEDFEGNDVTPSDEYLTLYNKIGIECYSSDEVQKLLNEHQSSLGVTEKIINGDLPDWLSLKDMAIGKYSTKPMTISSYMEILPGDWMLEGIYDDISGLYMSVSDTADFQIDITYADKFKAPGYIRGHLIFSSSEGYRYGEDQAEFYIEESNVSDYNPRTWLAVYRVASCDIEGNEARITLNGSGSLFESLTDSEDIVFVKENTKSEVNPAYLNYIKLYNPEEGYYCSAYVTKQADEAIVKLKQTACTENEITDDDVWFNKVGMTPPGTEYSDDNYIYRLGGTESYGTLTMLHLYDKKTGELLYNYDFHDFIYAEGYENDAFVDRSIRYAKVVDDILYVNLYHSTYASSCPQNAFIIAIGIPEQTVLWKSDLLTSNSGNFIVTGDYIISGYGFSAEDHYLTIIDRYNGTLKEKITVKKSPEYFCLDGDTLYVRTYSYDYVFQVSK